MKRKNIIQRFFMPLPELETYYRERRKVLFEQGKPLKYIQLREKLYPLFIAFLKIDRLFRRQKISILGDAPKVTGQVIYACTHIAGNDLENVYETFRRGCWWFIGDPCVLYKNISGLLLHLNGCIMLETRDKTDRHIAYLRAVELLKKCGSLMIYPEGARNCIENLPVMGLFHGTAKMAMETGVKIVPVGIEQFGRRFVIHFGETLYPQEFCSANELTDVLRDALATLKYEIWEAEGLQSRSDIPKDYSKRFAEEQEKRMYPYDTLETVERTRYHTKAELEQKEVEDHLDRLIPCKENAFLFRKK